MKNLQNLIKKTAVVMTVAAMTMGLMTGCGDTEYNTDDPYTYDEAVAELDAKLSEVNKVETEPQLYLYDSDDKSVALADIDTFPLTVEGRGQIDIEIAAATELTSKAPDDLMNVWARDFNAAGITIDGKSVSVSVRRITSGEIFTYMTEGDYRPDVCIASFDAWPQMLQANGIDTVKITDRLVGNTAGVLMKQDVYDAYIEKYKTVTMGQLIEASMAGDLDLALTNPYTSSTTLNELAEAMRCFDPSNPLSEKAEQKLLDYQKTSPHVSYTTAVLSDWAAQGVVDAMVMEEQAYYNKPALKDFVYTPLGVRHDHPVYTFNYVSTEKRAVAQEFVKYCLSDKAQKIADQKGFNRHDDYDDTGLALSGAEYQAVQKIWKANKDGGHPVIAVFVADISGSMAKNNALGRLKEALSSAKQFINTDYYIGLISYSDSVYVNLKPDRQFDAKQQSYFMGAVDSLTPLSGTATYNAILVALKELDEQAKALPDPNVKKMIFLLSDGDRTSGYRINDVMNIVEGMGISIYTIGYNLELTGERAQGELETLSAANEAASITASSNGQDNILNELRNLFNANL